MTRRGAEQGFTLVEVLVAMLIAGAVLAVATTVLTGASRSSDAVQRRTAALQQARIGLDTVVRSLRAQSCVPTDTTPRVPVIDATATSVTFFADLSGGADTPLRRRVALDTDTGTLTESVWAAGDLDGTGAANTRVLARDIEPVGSTPVFAFFAFNGSNPPVADSPLTTPLSAGARTTVARIVITMRALPAGLQDGTRTTTVTGAVFTRLADPDGAAVPQCV